MILEVDSKDLEFQDIPLLMMHSNLLYHHHFISICEEGYGYNIAFFNHLETHDFVELLTYLSGCKFSRVFIESIMLAWLSHKEIKVLDYPKIRLDELAE